MLVEKRILPTPAWKADHSVRIWLMGKPVEVRGNKLIVTYQPKFQVNMNYRIAGLFRGRNFRRFCLFVAIRNKQSGIMPSVQCVSHMLVSFPGDMFIRRCG